jgi:hypothetical protein
MGVWFHTWVCGFIPGGVVSYLGVCLHTQVCVYIPGCVFTYLCVPDMRCGMYVVCAKLVCISKILLTLYEIKYQIMKLRTQV